MVLIWRRYCQVQNGEFSKKISFYLIWTPYSFERVFTNMVLISRRYCQVQKYSQYHRHCWVKYVFWYLFFPVSQFFLTLFFPWIKLIRTQDFYVEVHTVVLKIFLSFQKFINMLTPWRCTLYTTVHDTAKSEQL